MILPSKHLTQSRSLIGVGAGILVLLDSPQTVSALWNNFSEKHQSTIRTGSVSVSFDWFILALDLLQTMKAIEFKKGRIRRKSK